MNKILTKDFCRCLVTWRGGNFIHFVSAVLCHVTTAFILDLVLGAFVRKNMVVFMAYGETD